MAFVGKIILGILIKRYLPILLARMSQRGVGTNFLVATGLAIIERSIANGMGRRQKRSIPGLTRRRFV